MRTTSKTEEPFREKSGSISKRLFCVHLAAKWFSFCDFGRGRTIVIDFPENDFVTEGCISELDDMFITWLRKAVDDEKVSLRVFDLQKKTECRIQALVNLASKGIKKAIALRHRYTDDARNKFILENYPDFVSVIASSDMVRQADISTADGSTLLSPFSQSPSFPWPSTTTSGPLANVLTYIDGQSIVSPTSFEECSLSVTAIFSALVNLTDYVLSTVLNQRERNECKLGLACFILSLQRLLEQREIRIPGIERPCKWQDGLKTGPFSAALCENWLPMLVQKAHQILNDDNATLLGQLAIATTKPWNYRVYDPYGEFDKNGKVINTKTDNDLNMQKQAYLLPSVDRVRMILDDKIYWPYGHVKCNQKIQMGPDRKEVVVPCPMKFYNRPDLLQHIKRFHGVSEAEAGFSTKKYFSCSLCSEDEKNKTFRLEDLVPHLRGIHRKVLVPCMYPECPSFFLSVEGAKNHMGKCKRKIPEILVCKSASCFETFVSESDRREHMMRDHLYFYCHCGALMSSYESHEVHMEKYNEKINSNSQPEGKRTKDQPRVDKKLKE